jgi:hypothetical protein
MKKLLVAVLVLGVAAFCQNAYAGTLLDDNFDSETLGLNYTGFANWAVTSGSVDLIGAPDFYDFFPGNGRYVDLSGSTDQAGIISSLLAFTLNPGYTYSLSFDLGGSARSDGNNTATVQLGAYSESFDLASNFPLTNFMRNITVSSPINANLIFAHEAITGADNMGLILDNVKLTSVPVPEPISTSLFLLGSGAMGLKLFRRKKA